MFSVVIPLHNKQNAIPETIQCVLNQSYNDFEIVIIDDGSTDDSALIVKQIKDPRIRLIQKINGGVSSARNRGIEEAHYNYIALLDADDIWENNYLEEQAKLISDFPEAGMWGCAWGYLNSGKKEWVEHISLHGFRGFLPYYFSMEKKSNIFWSSSVVIKKEVFSRVGFFDERIRYSEDLDMWYRIILNFPVVFYNRILSYYCLDAENRAMNKEIPLQYMLPYYIEKYSDYRIKDVEFRRFFDRFCLSVIYPYFKKNKSDSHVQRILSQINMSEQNWTFRFKFTFPWLFDFLVKLKK